MVGIVAALASVRAVERLAAASPASSRELAFSTLDEKSTDHDSVGDTSDLAATSISWLIGHVFRTDGELRRNLDALKAGTRPPRAWRALLYRSHRFAAESSIRAGARFLLVAAIFATTGWSSVDVSLSFVAIIITLGATTPDPRAFTIMAAVAAPIAALFAGILEFVVLDGVTAFPLLAVGLAPFMIGASLLMTMSNRILSALGRINLVWILLLFSPSNPQTYNPQAFLFSVLFLLLATSLLVVMEIVVPPVSRDRRLQWLLVSMRRDLGRLPFREEPKLGPEEAMFRDASRISEILAAGNTPEHQAAVEEAIASFDQAVALRLCKAELEKLTQGPLETEVGAAYAALAERDPDATLAKAHALREAAFLRGISATGASAALMLASVTFSTPYFGAARP
jgi:hypothetical protein